MAIGLFELFVIGFIAFVFVSMIIGAIIHMILFGTIFGVAINRIKHQIEQQDQLAMATAPISCTYCQTQIPANTEQCPGCGAKRG